MSRGIGTFRVAVSSDFERLGRELLAPALRDRFDALPCVEYHFVDAGTAYAPGQLADCDALLTLHPQVTAASLEGADRLAVIARWGVGYNMIDVPACTAHDVLLAITPDAVRRPVAEGALTLLLAISHHLLVKDRLVREGGWQDKSRYPGLGLAGRTLGLLGLGNTAAELVRLVQPFGFAELLVHDPFVDPATAAGLGCELVELADVLERCDFLCIMCPLNDQTLHLIDEAALRRMKPSAMLVNIARGPIVDEPALIRALDEGWIAGAALDVFEHEPIDPDNPLLKMDNVILSPHAIAWTDALMRDNSFGACDNVLSVLRGAAPAHVVNREVIERPGFADKLNALARRWEDAHAADGSQAKAS